MTTHAFMVYRVLPDVFVKLTAIFIIPVFIDEETKAQKC